MLSSFKHRALIAGGQALAVVIYCGVVSLVLWYAPQIFTDSFGVLSALFMLVLLVFSAGITGTLVFAYPVYLAMNKKVGEALGILGYTFLWLLFFAVLLWGLMWFYYRS